VDNSNVCHYLSFGKFKPDKEILVELLVGARRRRDELAQKIGMLDANKL